MNIVLIGFMACGKSSIGRYLSSRLGKKLVEMDELIEDKAGMSINGIFDKVGEKAFRDLETYVCRISADEHNAVISTGGGCVLREQNRKYLRDAGLVVWLRSTPENVLKFGTRRNNRPLLRGADVAKVKAMMDLREPMYAECSHMSVDVAGLNLQAIFDVIVDRLNEELANSFALAGD